ncbi:aldo/keto reductase [Geodermatophilus sp. CPCC 205761]|uniref:aldo/keto reductase n=1 Tax=Geodermatophilus sp. CPCC 205761 TaxID=2936597 RepID=UPI003EEBF528
MTSTVATLPRRRLGTSDLTVSVCGLGGNVFGPPRLDAAATREVIAAALDLGVDLVDTADVYGQGRSEALVGAALGARRDRMVIATKFNLRRLDDAPVAAHVRRAAEASLRRLGTDRIDLYQLHFPPDGVDPAELLDVLDDLVREGKVRALGICNAGAWRVSEANHLANARGRQAFATVQDYYHLLARGLEAEVLPYARRTGVGVLPYHPLAGGFLTGKYRQGAPRPAGTRGAAGSGIVDTMDVPAHHATLDRLRALAGRLGRPLSELALAWLAGRPGVASVIAGVSSVAQLRSNVAGCSWQLDPAVVAELDAITAPAGVWSPERLPYEVRRPTAS